MQIRSLSLTMALARRPLREAVEPQEFDKTGAPGLTSTWFSTLARQRGWHVCDGLDGGVHAWCDGIQHTVCSAQWTQRALNGAH